MLKITKLKVEVEGKEILKGISLEVGEGEVHVVMGPNGSGKSTLAMALMGHPKYQIISGEIIWTGVRDCGIGDRENEKKINLLELNVTERAKLGIFLGFQSPIAVEGVSVLAFLWRIKNGAVKLSYVGRDGVEGSAGTVVQGILSMKKFKQELSEYCESLGLDEEFLKRNLNEGFSGGERKKLEVLQMLVIQPKLVILDEIDSGTDVDTLKRLGQVVNNYVRKNKDCSVVLITHYNRILKYIKPNMVHVISSGVIVESGDKKLATKIEREGFANMGRNEE